MKKFLTFFLCVLGIALLPINGPMGWTEELDDEQKLARIDDLYRKYKRSFPDVPDVTVKELIAMRKERDVVLVDGRKRKEQAVSMLPGAIPSREFERNIEQYRDKTIVVYCTIGSRSGHYTAGLIKKGFTAYNLRGSILAWTHAGEKLVSEGKETRRVHVYGRTWNLVPEGYEAVW
jgi:rhodanese-related sulfurtransferase